eukprot:Plantae.Rhodophyta-Purpureofilum_apyrenoidigerum.ctg5061.p1 GENE.Plantae.Rhodophyta-Purpureofilum_apyrenoidigerum.ctg5061~~Plantae.Rhodophyta-Purpureofilum_apyrenoidigerum.ctg5061.p1  ORF type:complete len:140 (-),score=20.96 Plantae.Rhodophyta-Purpureofilum_apyrenoidigerum.ctg5061:442-861(-)
MASEADKTEEPVTTETLGRATWTFLHTLAANYPKNPTPIEQTRMRMFMSHFSQLYPCEICQVGLKDTMMKMPPEVESSRRFKQWMCKLHNDVNEHIGKDLFDCSKVDERWGVCESCQLYKGDLNAFKKLMQQGFTPKKP